MTLAKAYYNSPIGTLIVKVSHHGISAIQWSKEIHKEDIPEETKECVSQLDEYFKGHRKDFNLKLDWSEAADFDKKVWTYLLQIPYGRTVSYTDVAVAINSPKAVRAVGAANSRNPIPIVVPCHRVIGKNGDLVGFAGGLDTKAELLRIERPLEFGKQGNLF